ncbi:MAG: aldo/keto reductase [Phycisphaerae bacterium]|nr:aldo/keto reductase [Phycisphaerae bacterium]
MQYKMLGDSGLDASIVGLGCWAIGGWLWGGCEHKDAVEAIKASIDNGVNLIDTAPAYGFGRSEEIVGDAIASQRDKVIIASKCGLVWHRQSGEFYFHTDDQALTDKPSKYAVYKYLGADSIVYEVEQSLKRLKTDYIDLMQTHWQETTTPIAEVVEALQKLKQQGKIRSYGVSNVTVDHLVQYGPVASAQQRFSMLYRENQKNGTLDYCHDNNIAVLAFSPMEKGLLTGKMGPDYKFGEKDLRLNDPLFSVASRTKINGMLANIKPIANAHKISLGQLVIAWTAQQKGITHVLCGARNAKQAIENARAGDVLLNDEEIKMIDAQIQTVIKTS